MEIYGAVERPASRRADQHTIASNPVPAGDDTATVKVLAPAVGGSATLIDDATASDAQTATSISGGGFIEANEPAAETQPGQPISAGAKQVVEPDVQRPTAAASPASARLMQAVASTSKQSRAEAVRPKAKAPAAPASRPGPAQQIWQLLARFVGQAALNEVGSDSVIYLQAQLQIRQVHGQLLKPCSAAAPGTCLLCLECTTRLGRSGSGSGCHRAIVVQSASLSVADCWMWVCSCQPPCLRSV